MKKRAHTHELDGKFHDGCAECKAIIDLNTPGGRAARWKEADDNAARMARKLVKK